MPSLLEGAKMTVQITLLGLIGGTIIGFLTGVITTYVKVLVTWKTRAFPVRTLVAWYILGGLVLWVGGRYGGAVPDWACVSLQVLIAMAVLWLLAAYIPVALSF